MCDPLDVAKDVGRIVTNPWNFAAGKLGLPHVPDLFESDGGGSLPGPTPSDKPPPPPDLTDEQVQRARAAMVRRMLGMQGIGSTFLTGPTGLPDAAPTQKPGLTGA